MFARGDGKEESLEHFQDHLLLPEGQLGGDTSANGGLCSVLGKAAAFSVV